MKFSSRRAVSPIIATLLLIAITVAAGIIVYVFVNGISGNLTAGGGQQMTERLQMQSFNFDISPGSCACSGQVLELFLLNSGSSTSTISSVYFDGTLQTLALAPVVNTPVATGNAYYDVYSATLGSTSAGDVLFSTNSLATLTVTSGTIVQIVIVFGSGSAPTPGTAHTVKVVSSTGATNVYSVVAGRTG